MHDEALRAAYETTEYRVTDSPVGPLAIRIGEVSDALDRLLAMCGATGWAYVTACNPRSVVVPDDENRLRSEALRQRLARFTRSASAPSAAAATPPSSTSRSPPSPPTSKSPHLGLTVPKADGTVPSLRGSCRQRLGPAALRGALWTGPGGSSHCRGVERPPCHLGRRRQRAQLARQPVEELARHAGRSVAGVPVAAV